MPPVSGEARPRCTHCLFFLRFYGVSIFPWLDDMSKGRKAVSSHLITEDIYTPDEPLQPEHQPYPVALFTETYVKWTNKAEF